MKALTRLLMIGAVACLGLLFLFPMWKIYLEAPQYPEGLEMHIWINKIGGNTEFTLHNFNILNHYIGMAPIHPESFKELQIMPWVVIGFIITGLLIAVFPRRQFVLAWLLSLMIAGAIGLVDFYLWLERFGTDLDPMAPIKIPGMTYIPPFLGSKQLLNFHALSLPGPGGFGVLVAIILAGIAVYLLFFRNKAQQKRRTAFA